MQPYASAFQLLQTIPGIDQISAAMILIETGDDLTLFGSAERFTSWAASVPATTLPPASAKTAKPLMAKAVIRSILCECDNAARNTRSVFASKYQSLVIRRWHKKAIIAIAHKTLRTIFFVLTGRQPYRDSGFDYQAVNVANNEPRWIKALKQFGYWPNIIANA